MTSTVDPPHQRGDVPAGLAAALGSLMEALDVVLAVEPHAHGAAAAHVAGILGSVASRAAVGQARLLPVIEADGRWALGGQRSLVQWAAANLRLPVSSARAQVRLGRALRDHLPETAEAATVGEIGHEAAHVLAALAPTTQARRAVLADREHECNESFLVEQARSLRVDDLRRLTRAWAYRADPAADDRGFVEASEREHLELARLPFGYRVEGQLTVEHGQQLQTALAAVMGVPASTDGRSTTQRRAQGLADLARLALDHGLVGTGNAVRPQVTVHIDHTTFRRLVEGAEPTASPAPATSFPPAALQRLPRFPDGTTVPRALLDRLACDTGWNRIIFGPQSEVLDAGRTARTYTGARRAAVVARDRHCQHPGCTAPPALSEVHHVRHWARDHGRTDVAEGVLLCWHHHDLVHRRGIEIARAGAAWRFSDRHGLPLRQ